MIAVSCSKSDLQPAPGPLRNDTPVQVSLTAAPLDVPFTAVPPVSKTATRASGRDAMTVEYGHSGTKSVTALTSDQEQKVHDLWVIQFDKASGALVGQPYYAAAGQIGQNGTAVNFEARLTSAATPQKVYFVANTHSPSLFHTGNCGTVAALEQVCREIGDAYRPTAASGLPMLAVKEYASIASGTPLTGATLRRLVAKVVLRYRLSASMEARGFTVTGVRLRNVPGTIRYASEQTGAVDYPALAAGSHIDYPADNPGSAVPDGDYETLIWYMPENLRKAVVPVEADKDRVPANTDGAAAYIEIRGEMKSPEQCRRVVYSIVLGDVRTNNYNDYNVRRNNVYTATVDIEGLNGADKRVTIGTFDMNNSAMVVPNSGNTGAVTFDIRKLTKGWQTTMPALGSGAELRAALLWTDNASLASQLDVNLDKVNGLLTVKSTGSAVGNAVVALYDKAAAGSGEILWSWHIWVTGYAPAADRVYCLGPDSRWSVPGGEVHTYGTTYLATNPGKVIMDRNLGATKTYYRAPSAGDLTADQAFGLFYQWGRKDPFPRVDGSTIKETTIHDGKTIPIYGADGNTPLPEGEKDNTTAAGVKKVNINAAGSNPPATFNYAVKNPLTFIYNSSTEMGDWLTSTVGNQNNALWGDGGPKSAYDPCPEGWRVPKTGTWNDIGNDNFQYYLNGTAINNGATGNYYQTNGRLYIPAGMSVRIAWYPAGGLREPGSGKLTHGGSRGYSWSCTPNGDIKSKYVDFGMEGVGPQGQVFRAFGFPVRCIQE